MTIRVQVIRVYELEVETPTGITPESAVHAVENMQSTDIESMGKLMDISVDFAEVVQKE